ncbi:MAG TPA: hypothetical protein VGJ51_14410, partial [Candidatus Angelobacter sp.]
AGIFKIQDHKIVWLLFRGDPSAGIFIAAFAAALWGIYFIQRWKFKRTGSFAEKSKPHHG